MPFKDTEAPESPGCPSGEEAKDAIEETTSTFFAPEKEIPAGGGAGKCTDLRISGANAKVVTEAETFAGEQAIDGAIGQPSEAKGARGEVVGVDVLEADVPLAVLRASSSGSEDSRRDGAIAGAAREHLTDRLTGSVLTTAVGESALWAALTTGAGPSATFFVTVSSEGTPKEDALGGGDSLCAVRANGSRVGSLLVGSPAWAAELGAPTFTSTEVGRFLRPSVAGRGGTGTPTTAGEAGSLLPAGPDGTGGDAEGAGAAEVAEG